MNTKNMAREIRSDLENCMSDLAGGDEILADEYWNDPATLSDLLGDRIFDRCGCFATDDDKIMGWEIADHLLKISHEALKEAVLYFKRRQDFI